VADGVVMVSGERVDAAARDRIAAALAGVRGVARVDVVEWTARQTVLATSGEAPRGKTAPDGEPPSPRPAAPDASAPAIAAAAAATAAAPTSPSTAAPPASAVRPAVDKTLPTGWQFDSVQVLGRKLVLTLEYFNGNSPNGQFFKDKIQYFGVAAHLYY